MATSVSSLSNNFFPSPQSGFTTTLASSVSAGATSVPLNSVAGYSNGEVAVLVIDPGNSSKQTFTGVVDTAGIQLTSVVWTAGTNVAHTAGAVITDYATATHIAMMSKGIKIAHNQDGTHKSGAVYTLPTIADFTNATHDHSATSKGGQLSSTAFATGGLNTTVLRNPYKFSVWLSANQAVGNSTTAVIGFDTREFDTSSNVDITTNKGRFTAPIAGFYQFNFNVQSTESGGSNNQAILYKNGSICKDGTSSIQGAGTSTYDHSGGAFLQLALNDYIEITWTNTTGGSKNVTGGQATTYFQGFLVSAT